MNIALCKSKKGRSIITHGWVYFRGAPEVLGYQEPDFVGLLF